MFLQIISLDCLMWILRMFDAMGKIFVDNCKEDIIYRGLQIDRKRRRELQELKRASGIKSSETELERW